MYKRFKRFNVNFGLLRTIYVHFLVCYLNKLQTARLYDKDKGVYGVLDSDEHHHHSVVSYVTTTRTLPKVTFPESTIQCFHFHVSLRPSGSSLRFLPRLPVIFIFPSTVCFRRHFVRKM